MKSDQVDVSFGGGGTGLGEKGRGGVDGMVELVVSVGVGSVVSTVKLGRGSALHI